jgi:hypothetical protein
MNCATTYRKCPRCSVKMDANSQSYCAPCKSAYAKEYYQTRLRPKSRCGRCKSEKTPDKQVYCKDCRRAYNRERSALKRQARPCTACGSVFEPPNGNRTLCDDCRAPKRKPGKPCKGCDGRAMGRKWYCEDCGKITPQQRQYLKKKSVAPTRACECGQPIPPKQQRCPDCKAKSERRKRERKAAKARAARDAAGKQCRCGSLIPNGKRNLCEDCRIANARACWARKDAAKAAQRQATGCQNCGGATAARARLCPVCRMDSAVQKGKVHRLRRDLLIKTTNDGTVKMDEIWVRDKGRCRLCKTVLVRETAHLDHIIPLSKGGPHWRENVQLLCACCNSWKGDALLFGRFYALREQAAHRPGDGRLGRRA